MFGEIGRTGLRPSRCVLTAAIKSGFPALKGSSHARNVCAQRVNRLPTTDVRQGVRTHPKDRATRLSDERPTSLMAVFPHLYEWNYLCSGLREDDRLERSREDNGSAILLGASSMSEPIFDTFAVERLIQGFTPPTLPQRSDRATIDAADRNARQWTSNVTGTLMPGSDVHRREMCRMFRENLQSVPPIGARLVESRARHT
jgi:hypothetical protein